MVFSCVHCLASGERDHSDDDKNLLFMCFWRLLNDFESSHSRLSRILRLVGIDTITPDILSHGQRTSRTIYV